METLNFDTHENVKKLLSVGFTEEQAEMHTEILGGLVGEQMINRYAHDKLQLSIDELRRETKLSTEGLRQETKLSIEELKRDIEGLRQETKLSIEELKRDIEVLRQETKLSQAELKHDLTLRMGGIMVSSMAIMFGMLKLFP